MRLTLDPSIDLPSLHAFDPARYPFLLESVGRGEPRARWDILLVAGDEWLELDAGWRLGANGYAPQGASFLDNLDRWWAAAGDEELYPDLPFAGGWFLYLGYELAAEIEPRLRAVQPSDYDHDLPLAHARRCPAAFVRDRIDSRLWFVAEEGREDLAKRALGDAYAMPALREEDGTAAASALEEEDPARFLEGVRAIRRHIAGGDVFQVNLSRAWQARIDPATSDLALYRRLRRANPSPFSALARIGAATIVSSSPERLASVRDGIVQTRPIAGTHPRGADPAADRALVRALLGHPKERAEHIMLIDLERNDLGRVCEPGSVRVDELMSIETYAHVHHIVSNVRGRLRPGVTPGAVVRAVFPGGTITGCPKVRCMEIIAALEGRTRGAYTGSLGYLGRGGRMDLNILIRTLVRSGDRVHLRAGAGIVADSDPDRELAETRSKAEGLLRILRDD